MQTTGDDAEDNDADDEADVETDDNAAMQTTDDDPDNNAWEVKTNGGTSEAKMGRGGGHWGRRGGLE